MMNILFSVLICSFCLQMFTFSMTIGKVSRVFDGFDYSYAEFAVSTEKITQSNGLGPYFYQYAFEKRANDYFEEHLSPFISSDNYKIECSYSSPYTVNGVANNRYCKRATLNFEATFCGYHHYKNSKSFIIKEKA